MLQQTTMWKYLKRDASSTFSDTDADVSPYSSPPTPKRARSSISLNNINNNTAAVHQSPPPDNRNDIFSSFCYPSSLFSVHTSSRTLSSPTLSKMDCDDSQMILDCGQKRFGPELCPKCGMFYSPTNGDDALVHERYHRQLTAPPRFNRRLCNNGTSLFVCVQEYDDGSIFKCSFDNDYLRQNKSNCQSVIEDICARMNDELGQETNRQRTNCYANISASNSNLCFDKCGRQLYVFVNRADNAIHGVLISDHVKFAYRYNAEGYLDEQPRDARMGVNRIWTWAGARRRRVGTRLVECARCNFYFGTPILKKHVAFSDPTASGLEFAKKYCGSDTVLVYRFG